MKLNKLVIACGALFAAGAGSQALAVDLYVSGASALQISFQKAVAEMCATTGSRAFFTNANGQSYQCMSKTTGAGAPFPGVSKPLNIWKRNAGGSGFGVFPVASNSNPAPYNNVTFTSQTGCTPSGTVVIGGLTWSNNINCPDTGHIFPDAGVSDVEPKLFGYNGSALAAASPIVAQVFGIPVNDKLYRQLQATQGIGGNTVAAVTAADPSFLPMNAPSLTYAQVRSLFTADYNDFTQVNAAIVDAGNGSTSAKVCRRVATSGTQAVINALLLNNPCGNGSFGGLLNPSNNLTDDNTANNAVPGAFSPTTGGYTVVMNSGNAQVDACLTDANVKGELAIGILGTERVPNATPSDDADGIPDQWHYVKLSGGAQPQQPPVGDNDKTVQHGAYPNVDNTIASTYDLYAEATFNRRPNSSYPGAIGADKIAVMNKLPALMGDPATILSENLLGLAALPANGYDPTVTYPTLKGGRSGNTCRPTTLQY